MGFEDRTCWVVQGGPRGRHVAAYVRGDIVSVGWDWAEVGDLRASSDAEIYQLLEALGRRKPADDLRDLRIFTDRMAEGDVVVVTDTGTGDLVFGEISGGYAYAPLGGAHRHTRSVRWFGRFSSAKAEPLLVAGAATKQMLRRLPEQLHWQRLAGEVEDFLGRPVDDVPMHATRPASTGAVARRTGTRASTRAPAKPAPLLTPDRLCPGCGLLRAPSMYVGDEAYCRDCA